MTYQTIWRTVLKDVIADDSMISRITRNENDGLLLQIDLDDLQHWEKKEKMKFDPDAISISNNKTQQYTQSTENSQTCQKRQIPWRLYLQ